MTDDQLEALKRKLAAREGIPGYEENVKDLKREIAALESDGRAA